MGGGTQFFGVKVAGTYNSHRDRPDLAALVLQYNTSTCI
jgi:hypothetical protein